mgnify:CR=1 FL=1
MTQALFQQAEQVDNKSTAQLEGAKEVVEDIVSNPVTIENYFAEMANMDVSKYLEKKNGFSYMSWAHAQEQLKRKHPDAKIIVKRFPEPESGGLLVPYIRTALGYFVEVEVIVNGVSVSEPFPVLDFRNKPIAKPTTFDINNSIQRAKVKMIAGHGLGLYVYAGEDLPNDADDTQPKGQNMPPSGYQQQGYQQQQQQQFIPPQVQMITQQQMNDIREKATQIAALTLGPGATQEQTNTQLKSIYDRYQIMKQMPAELATVKINDMAKELKQIHDSRMVANQPQTTSPFGNPQGDLSSVI